MSVWDKAKAKVDQAVGHAEELWGQSHGDAAAALDGEARRLEGEVEEEQAEHPEHSHPGQHPDDDGLAGAGAR
ncbi:hypothetical protein [Modestobacter roseus]|uniref:CsbD-like protein n=1 Tax=Modestobacter roseus TaxID=1181884 RepID=A0A562IV68_9ACTN|nr:hypothetical protein [Modestobacter roseus]MQA33524.1 hypothetical protein [Modestobacter roseus]TWH74842.1 hypothetical protein JD78_03387 [Modestobacter roseus]